MTRADERGEAAGVESRLAVAPGREARVDEQGRHGEPGGAGPIPPPRGARRRFTGRLLVPLLVVVLLAGGLVGYRYWQEQALYVYTENAQITGALVQVGSLNAGQIRAVEADVGDRVARGQAVATVVLASALGMTPGGTPKLDYRATDDQQVAVRSPIDGVVVARQGTPGDTVGVGQPILVVVDPGQFWVQAQVEETRIARVRVGQPVEVTVDTLGRTLPGRVLAVGRASAATFSLLPQGNASGNYTRVTQLVPVKIEVDYGDLPLILGSSVEVRIRVQD